MSRVRGPLDKSRNDDANGFAGQRLQLVCVSHLPDVFGRYVGSNSHVNRYPIVLYDNSVEKVGIAERYNHFIERQMGEGWCIFMHHDLCFDEDPLPRIHRLPTNIIYGVTGTRLGKRRRYAYVGLSRKNGLTLRAGHYYGLQLLGRIKCRTEIREEKIVGTPVEDPAVVDTVDCCCLIVHSSLIRRYELRFDPLLAWHFYSEDFSLNAQRSHGIETRVVQMDCGHYGYGRPDEDFYQSQRYLVKKYREMLFSSTCYAPPKARGIERFTGGKGLLLMF